MNTFTVFKETNAFDKLAVDTPCRQQSGSYKQ